MGRRKETEKQPIIRNVITIAEDNPLFDKGYWGASVTFDDIGGKTAENKSGLKGYNTYNYGHYYDDVEEDIKSAKHVADQVNDELERIEKQSPIL